MRDNQLRSPFIKRMCLTTIEMVSYNESYNVEQSRVGVK